MYIDYWNKSLKDKELDIEKNFKGYQNFETKEADLESFTQIVTKNFLFLKYDDEAMDSKPQKVITKPEFLNVSKFRRNSKTSTTKFQSPYGRAHFLRKHCYSDKR